MAESILLLSAGLILLMISGKFLVDSSVAISRLFRIPSMIIGLTVVSLGTSAPELLVSVKAAISGHPEIAMGNVVGSNISNILLVLGITALVFPVSIPALTIRRDWPLMMLVTVILFLFSLGNIFGRWEGIIMLFLLIAYVLFSVRQARNGRREQKEDEAANAPSLKWWKAVLLFVASCAGLAVGADLLVENAADIARNIGISERAVAVSMVAVGTSLPELVTSVVAAFKKETGIAMGNILGSNIMNILAVLGTAGTIAPIRFSRDFVFFDMLWMIGSAVLLLLFMIPARNGRINRFEGAVMLCAYLCYLYLVF